MVFLEVALQSIVVDVVLLLTMGGTAVANVASFVLISTVSVEFVIAIESLPTESTLWVALEAALVDSTRFVIAMLLVFPQIGHCEEGVLVSEHLFVACTKVTVMSYKAKVSCLVVKWHFERIWKTKRNQNSPHHLSMLALHMAMQVRPSKTGDITVFIGAVVSQQQHRVFKDLIFLIMDSQVLVGPSKVFLLKFLKSPLGIISEDDKGRLGLYKGDRLV
jgi:hypothetical protein